MAESPLDRLKRLAAEKKAAQAQPVVNAEAATGEAGASASVVIQVNEEPSDDSGSAANRGSEQLCEVSGQSTEASTAGDRPAQDTGGYAGEASSNPPEASSSHAGRENGTEMVPSNGSTQQPVPVPSSDHPLAMKFAELEAALLAQAPEFKTILREIHRHLGQEPELVTQMTEQEIQMVVGGLVVFANAEIVAPAAVKAAKAKIKEAGKKVISADDL